MSKKRKFKGNKSIWVRTVLRLDPCSYCGEPGETGDHITPRAHGGPNHWQNITSSCAACNTMKGDSTLLFFLLKMSRKLESDLAYQAYLERESKIKPVGANITFKYV